MQHPETPLRTKKDNTWEESILWCEAPAVFSRWGNRYVNLRYVAFSVDVRPAMSVIIFLLPGKGQPRSIYSAALSADPSVFGTKMSEGTLISRHLNEESALEVRALITMNGFGHPVLANPPIEKTEATVSASCDFMCSASAAFVK
ncbi:Molybdenum cofactor sulfurase [Echinococcus multilocularis]|uniref:Molybdenum cofactor sulfurase n=1 Tax=Echinococcus multilocularis TaxID=6211 RepID=A0A0S4MJB8_ECHMU|nr:Molybdenum cofactor sulfurase [Echinococcus multilocularis]